MGLSHPITFDGYDMCEQVRLNKFSKVNVTMLKATHSHFELPYKTSEVKTFF